MTSPPPQATQWQADELRQHLERGDEFFLFDVRNEDEFSTWRIEGRSELPTVNVPYYEMLEVDEHDDVVDSFQEFLERNWVEKLPREHPILAVCAKGDTSEYVAKALRRLGFAAVNLAGGTAAWGDHYHARPVIESQELALFQVARPARGCLSYLIASEGEAAVIDPLRHVDHYTALADRLGVAIHRVLDTHGHADHISGGPALAAATGAPYHLHPYDGIHPIDLLPARISYEYLEEGDVFTVGSVPLRALHTPGHTLGNMAFLVADRYLLTGDSIFVDSIGRPDLSGRAESWAPIHHRSLNRLLELPPETVVLPGHFSTLAEQNDEGLVAGTLEELSESNDGLRMARQGEEEFVAQILASLPEFPDQYVEIKRVNAGLVTPGEEKAAELELGKNICALADG